MKPQYKIEIWDNGWKHFAWRKNDTCLFMAEAKANNGFKVRVILAGEVIAVYGNKKRKEIKPAHA